MSLQIAPSILSADFSELRKEIEMINDSEADWFHLDIMDGVFVPNISFGFPVLNAVNKFARKPMDVHLMIQHPDPYLTRFRDAGASLISVHYEACTHLHRTLQSIHQLGIKAGIVLNPQTPVSCLQEIIREADVVLIMSVNPGFGGQSFIPFTYTKVEKLRQLIAEQGTSTTIEVDGGVDLENAGKLHKAGAGLLVAGHSIFSSANPAETIRRMKSAGD